MVFGMDVQTAGLHLVEGSVEPGFHAYGIQAGERFRLPERGKQWHEVLGGKGAFIYAALKFHVLELGFSGCLLDAPVG